LKTNYGVSYETVSLTDAVMKAGGSALDIAGNIAKGVIGARMGPAAVQKFTAAATQGQAVLAAAAAIGGASQGLSINPHSELLFQGVKFREFEFSYKLIATRKEESDKIKEIVNLLRFHMYPELDGKSFLFKYPSDFDITFYNKTGKSVSKNKYLPFVMTCVLTDISVNYSGNNNFVTFKDTAAPVEVDITLKFKETQILTKEIILAIQESVENNTAITPIGQSANNLNGLDLGIDVNQLLGSNVLGSMS